MTKKHIETYYEGGDWKVRAQGNQRAAGTYDTKADAQSAGRERAMRDGVEHIVKKMDGSIGERNSYGNDPHPPKG